ncbi:phospholipase-like, Aminotransferase-like mobile domain protein [Artemisia annua]|uniref:Phospholipase-like, Aminotransferase-like mobile domain protein n=1 Tax=Artemisia annua TaxID=35608 RepID=A0A2U1MXB3_ARTAN|nr:phospholipase-like, Aminotransferase-like mobile domain protein [Artemisia annua]
MTAVVVSRTKRIIIKTLDLYQTQSGLMLVARVTAQRIGEVTRSTCFGPWLDLTYVDNEEDLIHYMLQKQVFSLNEHYDLPLIYDVNEHLLHFGRREFCLITGFKFGIVSFRKFREGDIIFRDRVFPEKIGRYVRTIDLLSVIEDQERFTKLSDEDSVRVCLLLSLEVIFMGRELGSIVDDVLLRMVDGLEAWNEFPWGEHIWRELYAAIRNVNSKHNIEHHKSMDKDPNFVPSNVTLSSPRLPENSCSQLDRRINLPSIMDTPNQPEHGTKPLPHIPNHYHSYNQV